MPTYRLDLVYDGSGFHGYARQRDVRTVQGCLEEALFRLTGPVETAVAGRTDAGVHARGQVVSFVLPHELDIDKAWRALNGQLGPEMAIREVQRVEDGFHARFSALSRTYRYSVLNSLFTDPFLRHTTWHVPHGLKVEDMEEAARSFRGEHDFASFCRAAAGRSRVRNVLRAGWCQAGEDLLSFEIRATSFCHQMVRSIVALCVEVGRGRLRPAGVSEILDARDRQAARGVAPPHGLMLWEVEY
ncbi:MAG: tRNA pseudouridine(38-40) synthase TruA [Actinomycetota bacterium]|nr:tRNA pseudouridine(38-40) synthase TruA [Actinomycetota bacterium]